MSRIGREPITVPQGVTIEVNNDVVTVKGPKGTLSQQFDNSCIAINVENGNTAFASADGILYARDGEGNATILVLCPAKNVETTVTIPATVTEILDGAFKGNSTVDVILHDGTRYDAAIIGAEEDNDVAVLKIEANDLNPAVFGDSDSLLVGDKVYMAGRAVLYAQCELMLGDLL